MKYELCSNGVINKTLVSYGESQILHPLSWKVSSDIGEAFAYLLTSCNLHSTSKHHIIL